MSNKLFTGVYPPSPPPQKWDSYPEFGPQSPESDNESLGSSASSIPPKSPRKRYSSRLQQQHLALTVLPDIIVPPSRETTPESWKRAASLRDDMMKAMANFKEEHRSAELGAAYIGD